MAPQTFTQKILGPHFYISLLQLFRTFSYIELTFLIIPD